MQHTTQLFLRHLAQTSPSPLGLHIQKAQGVYLYGEHKAYFDFISGISVSNLGHSHPSIVAAVQAQAASYMHTMVYGEFVLSPQVQLAELLARHLAPSLSSVYFTNSGAEATEGAMKLAKRYTGRRKIIASFQAYHGSTQGALSLMSEAYFTDAFQPLLPNIEHIQFNHLPDLAKIDEQTAAVIVETVKAEVGVELPQAGYLQALRQRCTEVGALLILDEIQVGCGRTGSLFAFEQYGVVPDVLLLAKGFGGGMPLGAFIASPEIMSCLSHDPILGHITTFGGHPVCCAAALASLQILTQEQGLISSVQAKAEYIAQYLGQHPKVRAIRYAGLLMALQLDSFEQVWAVIQKGLELGIVVDWFLFNNTAVRLAPPLVISQTELEQACALLWQALDSLN